MKIVQYLATLKIVRRKGWGKFDTVCDEQIEFEKKQDAIDYTKQRLSEMMGVDCISVIANVRKVFETICGEGFEYVFYIDNSTLKDIKLWKILE